jgi:uncharacterized protein YjiS (DUF1127 family)
MTMHTTVGSSGIYTHIPGRMRRYWLVLREWQRRSRTREELRVLAERERKDLSFRREVHAEIRKWFWQP